uniref:SWIM-type domain-containing protein n=1 Tax=Lactuca sativa TaxID=4236 RepID=A0A9R1VXA0_LACSA|nr:hypothetical protein LSAT_V11C400193660 [Lactuca sativa]
MFNIIEESNYKPDVPLDLYQLGGKDKPKPCDTLATSSIKRKLNSSKIIIGCTTKIVFGNVYGTINYKARNMSYSEKKKEFVVCVSKAKTYLTMAHKIRAVLKGGYKYVGGEDAQIMINKMNDRRDHYPNYSFEFLCDGDQLAAMFWADEREKIFFYVEFGEVISFDASFITNKYKMVFVLFKTVDHHKKSFTLVAGLLSRETIESYEWLLKAFLRAHEGKASKIVLTDQYPTIKQIMHVAHVEKIQQKLTGDLFKNKDFKKRFNKLVWNMHIKHDEFEKKWELIINEFNLEDKIWFTDMFELRDKWISAYFSDTRITKRNIQRFLVLPLQTFWNKERMGLIHKVKLPTNDVKCTCEHFNRFGTLCIHAFNILMKHRIMEIPEKYIANHWRKDVISRHYHFGRHVYDTGDSEINRSLNQAYYSFKACLEYVRKNKDKMDLFAKKTESMLKGYANDPTNELTDVEDVGKLMGISIPKDINITVPNVQSNKGSGKKNKIQSALEIAYKYSNNQTRRCSGCGETALHNLRTCPIKLATEQSSKATYIITILISNE